MIAVSRLLLVQVTEVGATDMEQVEVEVTRLPPRTVFPPTIQDIHMMMKMVSGLPSGLMDHLIHTQLMPIISINTSGIQTLTRVTAKQGD